MNKDLDQLKKEKVKEEAKQLDPEGEERSNEMRPIE